MSAPRSRLGFLAILVASLLVGLLPAVSPPVRAATPDLTLVADTRYVVRPEEGRIQVTVALRATNHLVDTRTRRYFFERAFLAVVPGATNVAITSAEGKPTVRVQSAKADHTLLRIDFGGRLAAGASRDFTLTFDVVDPGGAPTRELRIGTSLITFPAWAFASESTPGGSVTVVFPPGYAIDAESDALEEPTIDPDGNVIYRTGRLETPLAFFAYFVADRPTDYVDTIHEVDLEHLPIGLTVRAWPDDPGWGERMGGLLVRGLPVLSASIGLPWTGERSLVVEEAVSRSAAGYAGRYDPIVGRIEIAYYADSYVALHEAAHAWFDGSLLADRWATEGFASWYALETARVLEEPVTGDPWTPELEANRIPLNDWNAAGTDPIDVENVGYAASLELARRIAERAGPEGLAAVWTAARDGLAAYQPVGADMAGEDGRAERGAPPPDWRGLLDLLEEHTSATYDDLWRTWVVRPDDVDLLAERHAARTRYVEVRDRSGDWHLPRIVRDAMRAWQFDQAMELLDAADRSLDDRDAVAAAAAAANLEPPLTLERTFEGARGFAAASAEADAQLLTIEAYAAARAARIADPGIIEEVGLWGATPEVELALAADAFTAGDLETSVKASWLARNAWEGARELGRNRAMSIFAAIAAILLGMLLARRLVLDRATRRRVVMAHRR